MQPTQPSDRLEQASYEINKTLQEKVQECKNTENPSPTLFTAIQDAMSQYQDFNTKVNEIRNLKLHQITKPANKMYEEINQSSREFNAALEEPLLKRAETIIQRIKNINTTK